MKELEVVSPRTIESPLVRAVRYVSAKFGHIPFPHETTDQFGGIARAEELLRQGFGLIIIQNHFSLRDPIESISATLVSETMRERPELCPVAYHEATFGLKIGAYLYGIEIVPIVTKHTVELGKNNGLAEGSGRQKYVERARTVISESGIIILAPQATRMERLSQTPDTPAVRAIVGHLRRNGVRKFALLFLGIGLKGVQNYAKEEVGGINFFRKATVNVGRAFTADEAIQEAGSLSEIDNWAYDQLRQVVPPAYR